MKLRYKAAFAVLLIGVFWTIALHVAKDVFATNQSTFTFKFINGGNAQSYVDYLIFEDTTSPFGSYNSADNELVAPYGNYNLGFNSDFSGGVPGNSSKTV